MSKHKVLSQPPSGGCVLKQIEPGSRAWDALPAAFGRLCVETAYYLRGVGTSRASRLRAAVC